MYIILYIIYKFCSTNEKLHHAPNKRSFFLLGRVGTKGVKFLLISTCSPQRPNGSPNVPFPNFHPYALPIFVLLEPIWVHKYWDWCVYIWNEYFYIGDHNFKTFWWWATLRGLLKTILNLEGTLINSSDKNWSNWFQWENFKFHKS